MPAETTITCLSLWQPWASLFVTGAKQIETRGWPFNHKGRLLVHAAKKNAPELRALCETEPFKSALARHGYRSWDDLPLGGIIGDVQAVRTYKMTDRNAPLDPKERAFGDYTPGRYGLVCERPRVLEQMIAYAGHQGPFKVPVSVLEGANWLVPGEARVAPASPAPPAEMTLFG